MKSIDIDILWQKVYRDYLGNEVSPLMMKWFKPVQPVLDGNTFILSVPDVHFSRSRRSTYGSRSTRIE